MAALIYLFLGIIILSAVFLIGRKLYFAYLTHMHDKQYTYVDSEYFLDNFIKPASGDDKIYNNHNHNKFYFP